MITIHISKLLMFGAVVIIAVVVGYILANSKTINDNLISYVQSCKPKTIEVVVTPTASVSPTLKLSPTRGR